MFFASRLSKTLATSGRSPSTAVSRSTSEAKVTTCVHVLPSIPAALPLPEAPHHGPRQSAPAWPWAKNCRYRETDSPPGSLPGIEIGDQVRLARCRIEKLCWSPIPPAPAARQYQKCLRLRARSRLGIDVSARNARDTPRSPAPDGRTGIRRPSGFPASTNAPGQTHSGCARCRPLPTELRFGWLRSLRNVDQRLSRGAKRSKNTQAAPAAAKRSRKTKKRNAPPEPFFFLVFRLRRTIAGVYTLLGDKTREEPVRILESSVDCTGCSTSEWPDLRRG